MSAMSPLSTGTPRLRELGSSGVGAEREKMFADAVPLGRFTNAMANALALIQLRRLGGEDPKRLICRQRTAKHDTVQRHMQRSDVYRRRQAIRRHARLVGFVDRPIERHRSIRKQFRC